MQRFTLGYGLIQYLKRKKWAEREERQLIVTQSEQASRKFNDDDVVINYHKLSAKSL